MIISIHTNEKLDSLKRKLDTSKKNLDSFKCNLDYLKRKLDYIRNKIGFGIQVNIKLYLHIDSDKTFPRVQQVRENLSTTREGAS